MNWKYPIAKFFGLRCPEWDKTTNDIGNPVVCRCERIAYHDGAHEAMVAFKAEDRLPLSGRLHQWTYEWVGV